MLCLSVVVGCCDLGARVKQQHNNSSSLGERSSTISPCFTAQCPAPRANTLRGVRGQLVPLAHPHTASQPQPASQPTHTYNQLHCGHHRTLGYSTMLGLLTTASTSFQLNLPTTVSVGKSGRPLQHSSSCCVCFSPDRPLTWRKVFCTTNTTGGVFHAMPHARRQRRRLG